MNGKQEDSMIEMSSLEQQYNELMGGATLNSITNDIWEKKGDVYKLFNLYDADKYDTIQSSNIQFKTE